MIFNFRIVSDEVDNFRREIAIDADATFLDFKDAICRSTGYDSSQMSSFFMCDDNWEKGQEITLVDMGSDSDQDIYLMDETPLSDFIDDDGQRLIFVFDYLTDRCFFLEMKLSEPGKSLSEPVITKSVGQAPDQNIDFDQFEATVDAKAASTSTSGTLDYDEDFYGDSGYNDDEFDPEAFDELSFDPNNF